MPFGIPATSDHEVHIDDLAFYSEKIMLLREFSPFIFPRVSSVELWAML